MIVVSSSLVLATTQDASPDHPVVGYANEVTIDNIEADHEVTDYPASNLANPSTALIWNSDDDAEQYLTVTLSTDEDVDYLAVARHNFGSAAIAVSVEGRADIADPRTELVDAVIPPDDAPLLFRFEPQGLAQIRLKMASGDEPPTAAVLYVGRLLVVQRKIYVGHAPLPYSREVKVVTGKSEAGAFLGRIVTAEFTETSVDLQNLTPSWVRSELVPFLSAAREDPFFFAWRPGSYPYEVGYCWLTNDPKPQNARRNGMMSVQLQIGGVVV